MGGQFIWLRARGCSSGINSPTTDSLRIDFKTSRVLNEFANRSAHASDIVLSLHPLFFHYTRDLRTHRIDPVFARLVTRFGDRQTNRQTDRRNVSKTHWTTRPRQSEVRCCRKPSRTRGIALPSMASAAVRPSVHLSICGSARQSACHLLNRQNLVQIVSLFVADVAYSTIQRHSSADDEDIDLQTAWPVGHSRGRRRGRRCYGMWWQHLHVVSGRDAPRDRAHTSDMFYLDGLSRRTSARLRTWLRELIEMHAMYRVRSDKKRKTPSSTHYAAL